MSAIDRALLIGENRLTFVLFMGEPSIVSILGKECVYFAYSTKRFSLIIVTRMWPGYWSSSSIFRATCRARS